uniref:TGF-beta family profile domain-containing protein n=1 Tax=Meloidogyne enterolobii TaxID=390850 RepID=A0A6V7UXR5_MELEN|nr:unnamed protein product [Meloidogyne enterolobii]
MFFDYFLPFLFLQFFNYNKLTFQSPNLQEEWPTKTSPLKTAELKFMKKLFENRNYKNNAVYGYEPKVLKKGETNCRNDENVEEEFVLEFEINGINGKDKLLDAQLQLLLPETKNHHQQIVKHKYRHNSIFKHNKISKHLKKQKLFKINYFDIFVFSGNNCSKIEKLKLQKLLPVEDETIFNLNNWFIYNVKEIIERNLKENKLNLIIKIKQNNLKIKKLPNFAYSHGPFLVVYTENNEIIEDENTKNNKRIKRDIFNSKEDNNLQIQEHMDAVRRQAEYFAYGMALPTEQLPQIEENNYLVKPIQNIPNKFENTKFALRRRKLKNRRKIKQKLSRKSSFDANDPMLGFGTNKSPWERSIKGNKFGNSLNDFKELEENERDGMMMNKHEKNDKEINMGIKSNGAGGSIIKKCSRHNLTVDIRDLGLDERIVAPKSFEAGYCAGSCEYPLDRSLRPSNHAIFQSLIVKLQSITNNNITTEQVTPSVCCAPDKFDSLTMLYFNENGNLVLKNFPRMIVLQCGCI